MFEFLVLNVSKWSKNPFIDLLLCKLLLLSFIAGITGRAVVVGLVGSC